MELTSPLFLKVAKMKLKQTSKQKKTGLLNRLRLTLSWWFREGKIRFIASSSRKRRWCASMSEIESMNSFNLSWVLSLSNSFTKMILMAKSLFRFRQLSRITPSICKAGCLSFSLRLIIRWLVKKELHYTIKSWLNFWGPQKDWIDNSIFQWLSRRTKSTLIMCICDYLRQIISME